MMVAVLLKHDFGVLKVRVIFVPVLMLNKVTSRQKGVKLYFSGGNRGTCQNTPYRRVNSRTLPTGHNLHRMVEGVRETSTTNETVQKDTPPCFHP